MAKKPSGKIICTRCKSVLGDSEMEKDWYTFCNSCKNKVIEPHVIAVINSPANKAGEGEQE